MLLRFFAILLNICLGVTLVVFSFPSFFDVNRTAVFAHIIAFRLPQVLIALGFVVLIALIRVVFRGSKSFLRFQSLLFVLFILGNGTVLLLRGYENSALGSAQKEKNELTVLSWNTYGEKPGLERVTEIAKKSDADIIVLPETTQRFADSLAKNLETTGKKMNVHVKSFSKIYLARSTVLLISDALGEYRISSNKAEGTNNSTSNSPTIIAESLNGTSPKIVAVHANSPDDFELSNWRADLTWLAQQCDSANVIMAGDFNSTLDHFAGLGKNNADLGHCFDSARQLRSAALGTWPSSVPMYLASPIDHIMSTSHWSTTSFTVLDNHAKPDSDHRAIVATVKKN